METFWDKFHKFFDTWEVSDGVLGEPMAGPASHISAADRAAIDAAASAALKSAQNLQGAVGVIKTSNPRREWTDPSGDLSYVLMIAMRLHLHEGARMPLDHLSVCRINENRYAVFVVAKGEPVTIEDGVLFPSDELITKLRLLIG